MKTDNYNKKIGNWGEDLAAQFLVTKGYELKERNVYVREGEIDLICTKDDEIIFVEVKTRTNQTFGYAEEAISWRKKQKIKIAIEKYLVKTNTPLSPRFDVVIVEIFGPKPDITHYENVILDDW